MSVGNYLFEPGLLQKFNQYCMLVLLRVNDSRDSRYLNENLVIEKNTVDSRREQPDFNFEVIEK